MKRAGERLAALALFAGLAVLYCAPAVWSWKTRVIGLPGDTSFGLWNLWQFRHAVTHGLNPLWTDFQYWPDGANLILHHDTLFNDALAFFLIPRVGLLGAYNLLTLLGLTLSGWGVYLFARDFGQDALPALAGGALFAFGPATASLLLHNGTAPDYANLAPLPFFVWALARSARSRRLLDAALAALALTWVWSFNYYYFLFSVVLCAAVWAARERPLEVSLAARRSPARLRRALEIAAVAAALAALVWGPRGSFHGRGSLRAILIALLPFFAFWALLAARALVSWKPRAHPRREAFRPRALAPYFGVPALWALLNLPLVLASLYFMATGDYGTAASPWRGGGNPVDPLWLVLPGRLQPWWGGAVTRLTAAFGAPNAATLGLAALGAAAWLWRRGETRRDPWLKLWLAGALFSALITLGPWLRLAGRDLYLPLPFYFLHLLPVFNNLQHGLRFNVFAALFLALLFAAALGRLLRSGRRGAALALAALAAAECWPGPAPSFAWDPPAILQRLDARLDGAVLTVPMGAVFNGLSGNGMIGRPGIDIGWQPAFEKPIVGGYLTRVARRQYARVTGDPGLRALVAAQAGAAPAPVLTDRARAARWLSDLRVSYVLVRDDAVPGALRATISKTWPLTRLDAGDGFTLYAVKTGGRHARR